MKMKVLMGAAITAVFIVATGCVSHPGVIQDKTKPIAQGGYTVVGEEVSSTEFQAFVFGIPLADLRGSPARRMYKSCLNQAPGSDALIEYVTDTKGLNLYWLQLQWFTLTGTPVKTNNSAK